ncbi:hypothetical protein DH86_00001211 [Scytalidium sp. 3C]|nr:hypothetical protein DH86_00001211 [Scytalidium sp. 3C]
MSRRAAQSHAARSAHALTRRRRTIQHQAQKQQAKDSQAITHRVDSSRELGLISQLSADRKDPFMSFVAPFKPIEHFLLDHFVTAIVPLMRCNELPQFFTESMTREWVPLALTDIGLLDGIFLSACRHLAAHHCIDQKQQLFSQLAVRYKVECVQSLRGALLKKMPPFADSIVAQAVMLAYDELSLCDTIMSKRHIDGAVRMVTLNGGPKTLGLNGFLEHLLSNLLSKFSGSLRSTEISTVHNVELIDQIV